MSVLRGQITTGLYSRLPPADRIILSQALRERERDIRAWEIRDYRSVKRIARRRGQRRGWTPRISRWGS